LATHPDLTLLFLNGPPEKRQAQHDSKEALIYFFHHALCSGSELAIPEKIL
jgi:hypothetical protein